MELLFLFILVLGLYLSKIHLDDAKSVPTSSTPDDEPCDPGKSGKAWRHKWILKFEADKKGYLVCRKCKKIPGDD